MSSTSAHGDQDQACTDKQQRRDRQGSQKERAARAPTGRACCHVMATEQSSHPWLLHNSANIKDLYIKQAKQLCTVGHSMSFITMGWNFIHPARHRDEEKVEVSLLITATKPCFLPRNSVWAPQICCTHPWPHQLETKSPWRRAGKESWLGSTPKASLASWADSNAVGWCEVNTDVRHYHRNWCLRAEAAQPKMVSWAETISALFCEHHTYAHSLLSPSETS